MLTIDTFLTSILEGFGGRFGRIFGRFFGPKTHAKCKSMILAKTSKIIDFSKENCIFSRIRRYKKEQTEPKSMKNCMLFGSPILKAFGMDFGRFLGGQIHQFSHFFAWFLEANFEHRFRSQKNRKKYRTWRKLPNFGAPLRWSYAPGERKREGFRSILSKDLEVEALKFSIEIELAI